MEIVNEICSIGSSIKCWNGSKNAYFQRNLFSYHTIIFGRSSTQQLYSVLIKKGMIFPWKRISYIVGGKCRWILIRKSIQIQPYCSDHPIDTTISYLSSDLWFSHAFTSPINPRKRRFHRYLHQILTKMALNSIQSNSKS